ncbi:unnamed protein product, partial [Polarella glacialis]
ILSANFPAVVAGPAIEASITVTKLESKDTAVLHEAAQYDVYCWAKDSAVDTQNQPRPNYMTQTYLETDVGAAYMGLVPPAFPLGGRTRNVWVKDTTPPTVIYVSSEAITDQVLQITLQLNEPGTVWCQPVLPATDAGKIDIADVDGTTYIAYIKGRTASFMEYVHTAFRNVDVEVNMLDNDDGLAATSLLSETPYNIFCFAQDDWQIEADNSALQSANYAIGNTATPSMAGGNTGNEITFVAATAVKDAIGQVITLDLTPPVITVTGIASTETTITVTAKLSETGTIWCQAVRTGFNVPTILEILDSNYNSAFTYAASPAATTTVLITGYDRPRNYDNSY